MNDTKTLELSSWETPASPYQEEQIGGYCIGKHIYEVGRYRNYGMDGYKYFDVVSPLTLTTLKELKKGEWEEWMADSPTDYRAMQKYAEHAYGNVLTSGLGLGLLIHELCRYRAVDSITIIETSPEVMALTGKYIPRDRNIKLLWGDFWKFVCMDDSKWDWIIVDLWAIRGTKRHIEIYKDEIIPATKQLKDKYPEAQIVFHGFAGNPTIEQLNKSVHDGSTDELFWGLGDNDANRS